MKIKFIELMNNTTTSTIEKLNSITVPIGCGKTAYRITKNIRIWNQQFADFNNSLKTMQIDYKNEDGQLPPETMEKYNKVVSDFAQNTEAEVNGIIPLDIHDLDVLPLSIAELSSIWWMINSETEVI